MGRGQRALIAVLIVVAVVIAAFAQRRVARDAALDGAGAGPAGSSSGPTFTRGDPASDVASARIEGIVRDPDGKPIDGGVLALERVVEEARRERPVETTTSAAGGAFAFGPLARGRYRVTATAHSLRATSSEAIELDGEHSRRVDLRLGRGGVTLSGHVHDSLGGPIAGAQVTVSDERVYSTLTDADGAYAMTLDPKDYAVSLTASAHGYAVQRQWSRGKGDKVIDFLLHPGAVLRGRVLASGTEEPIAGVAVTVLDSDALDPSPKTTTTDDRGAFEVRDLDPGSYRLMARKGALSGRSSVLAVGIAEVVDTVVQLQAGGVLRGRVLMPDGAPIPGAKVLLALRGTLEWSATSDASGRYEVDGLVVGTVGAAVDRKGFSTTREELPIGPGETRRDFVLAVGAAIDGTIVDSKAQPIPNAELHAYGAWGTSLRTTADRGGHFTFDDLRSGAYEISASVGTESATLDVRLGPAEARTIQLVLRAGGVISGRITWASGGPAAGAHVYSYAGSKRVTTSVAADGTYELVDVPSGDLRLHAVRSERPPFARDDDSERSAAVTLAVGEKKSGIDFVLPRGGHTLRGHVLASDGAPAPRASVATGEACRFGAWAMQESGATTGVDGAFTLEDLTPGRHSICAVVPGGPRSVVKDVDADTSDLRIQLEQGVTLAGRVVRRDGRPVVDYTIAASGTELAWHSERITDPDGAFELRGVGKGAYTVSARTDDGLLGRLVDVSVEDGKDRRGLSITLAAGASVRGRVVDEGGAPLRDALVRAGSSRARTDASGAFVLKGLDAGETSLLVGDDYDSHVITLREGAELDVGRMRILSEREGAALGGYVGLQIENRDGRLRATVVYPGLPAAAAGLAVGDEIVTIDGKPGGELGTSSAPLAIRGAPGTRVVLEVDSATTGRRTVTLTRASGRPR